MYANPGGNHPSFDNQTKATALNSVGEKSRHCRAIISVENMGAAGSGSTVERIGFSGVRQSKSVNTSDTLAYSPSEIRIASSIACI